MSLVGVEIQPGEIVMLTEDMSVYQLNTNRRFNLSEDERFEVTRVNAETCNIRTVDTKAIEHPWRGPERKRVSFNVNRVFLRVEDPNAPRPRRLGEKPEDTDDMIYVPIDDPGLQWLFDDMGKFAEDKGYCNQYDALCARLGIPGRPREFKVKFNLGGIDATSTVRARSQREANEQVQKAMLTESVTFNDDE